MKKACGREYCVLTERFHRRDGQVEQLHAVHVEFKDGTCVKVPGSEFTINATLFFWQWVFLGPERNGVLGSSE